jgi:hypothetical protein
VADTPDDEVEKISTPRGNGARSMTSLTPGAPMGYDLTINGTRAVPPGINFSYTGADWMGPLPPMQPIAPPDVAGRTWDFIPGYNLGTNPRPRPDHLPDAAGIGGDLRSGTAHH